MAAVAGNKVAWYDRKPFRKITDNLLLHGLKALIRFDRRKRDIEYLEIDKINKILFVATAGIGDTLFATPAIRGLRKRFPQAQIWLLLNEAYFDFFKTNPYIDKAFCVPSNGYRKFLTSIRTIRKEGFDVAVISHAHDYAGTTRPYLAGIRFIVGGMWFRTRFWFLLSNWREHQGYKRDLYTLVERQLHLVKFLDCHPQDLKMEVYLGEEDYAKADKTLAELGVRPQDMRLGFQVRTQSFTKDWPAEKYIALGKELLAYKPQLKILLLGAKQDKETAELILKGIGNKNVFNLAGKTSLRESAAIVSKLSLLITGVTGMLHIATALGTGTVALLGGLEDPNMLGTITPENQGIIKAIKKPKTCNPCNMRVCIPPPKCMGLITVDEVLEAAKQYLTSSIR